MNIVSRFVGRHHFVQILLVARVLFGGAKSNLVSRSAVVADGSCDNHLVGQVGRPVDDSSEPFASPPDGWHRLKLRQFGLILVDRV